MDDLLTTEQILSFERRSNMTDDEALRYARVIESAVIARIQQRLETGGWIPVAEMLPFDEGVKHMLSDFPRCVEEKSLNMKKIKLADGRDALIRLVITCDDHELDWYEKDWQPLPALPALPEPKGTQPKYRVATYDNHGFMNRPGDFVPDGMENSGQYTAEQMREYALSAMQAQRKRDAEICRELDERTLSHDPTPADCADAIEQEPV